MEKLKYRIWDTVLNFYVDINYYVIRNGKIFFDNNGDLIDQTDKLIIELFTGLTDKNGKEIYKGDIVYISGVGVCTVIWDKSILGFLFIEEHTDDEYDYQDIIEEDLIIKGHIHE